MLLHLQRLLTPGNSGCGAVLKSHPRSLYFHNTKYLSLEFIELAKLPTQPEQEGPLAILCLRRSCEEPHPFHGEASVGKCVDNSVFVLEL